MSIMVFKNVTDGSCNRVFDFHYDTRNMDVLESWLKEKGLKYDRHSRTGYLCGEQIDVYYPDGSRAWDVVCNNHSIGGEYNKLEAWGDICWTEETIDEDGCCDYNTDSIGYKSAEEIIELAENFYKYGHEIITIDDEGEEIRHRYARKKHWCY